MTGVVEDTKIERLIPLPMPVKKHQVIGYFLSGDAVAPDSVLSKVFWNLPESVGLDASIAGIVKKGNHPIELLAGMDGFLAPSEDGKLKVTRLYEIFTDVGGKTGNVNSEGSILIHGNVGQGVEVVSGGDIEVRGLIEDATIRAKGKIVAKGGISGSNSAKLVAGGDLYSQFIQQAEVEAMGNVVAGGSIMNSNVLCGKTVVVKGRGVLVGGKVMAARGVEAGKVGTKGAVPTVIELGANPFRAIQLELLESEFENLKTEMLTIEVSVRHIEKETMGLVSFNSLDLSTTLYTAAEVVQKEGENIAEETLFQINKFGSGVMRLMRMKLEMEKLKAELDKVSSGKSAVNRAKLRVRSVAHPGVIITICGVVLRLMTEYEHVAFYLDSTKREIATGYL